MEQYGAIWNIEQYLWGGGGGDCSVLNFRGNIAT